MKIGFDAKRAFFNQTGLGQYSRWIIQSSLASHEVDQVKLYTPSSNKQSYFDVDQGLSKLELVEGPKGGLAKMMWRGFGVAEHSSFDSLDLYHGLTAELPISRAFKGSSTKKIVTIHDLLYEHLPQQYSFIDRQVYRKKTMMAAENSDLIVATSKQTKEDLQRFLSVDPTKIRVVHQTCDQQFFAGSKQVQATQSNMFSSPYILSLGGIEPRKNHELAIESFAILKQESKEVPAISDVKLVVAGRKTKHLTQLQALVAKHRLQGEVHFVQDFSFRDLPRIIAYATACCYLSRWEGFGIPIVECLAMEKPILVSDVAFAREVAGDAGLYIDPERPDELAHQLSLLINQPDLVVRYGKSSKLRAQYFDHVSRWNELLSVYQDLL